MRWRVYLIGLLAGILALPLPLARAETQTLQQRFLDIYLKINLAEQLEKQGDFRGALTDFSDCYTKLAKIHQEDPDWESALIVHRMEDCKAKMLELKDKAATQPTTPPPAPSPGPENPAPGPTPPPSPGPGTVLPPPTTSIDATDPNATLKKRLQQVEDELRTTKENLKDSQAEVETYRDRLEMVNEQLAALKTKGSVDDKTAKLLNENKALTDKLTAAQKEIDDFKANPKSKLALAEAQLKSLQEQYDASQAANKALQETTATLQQQLEQSQTALAAANQKLAAVPAGSPEYTAIKRENEVMRGILQRELQEQAHRDMAKGLIQEEFDNLKLKSKVLQENLDILATPMTPATTDEERTLLASLRGPGMDVAAPPANGNVLSTPATGTNPATTDNTTNTASATPPTTNVTPDVNATTNAVAVVTPPTTPPAPTPPATPDVSAATNAVAVVTPPPAPPAPPDPGPSAPPTTNPNPPPTVDPNAGTPAPPSVPDPGSNVPPTTSVVPPAETTVTTTTIKNNPPVTDKADPTQYARKAKLPDDMRDTAQQGADLFKMQRYDEAAAKYQTIIDKYPESLYAWSNLGVVRFQQGNLNDALKALQQAVKLSPTDAFSYSNLGIVYYQMNQYESAIDALNAAKALDPNDAKTRNYLGCAESQKGWQEEAEKEFRKAIEIDPNFGDAHFNLALVYATSKPPSLELARHEYDRAIELGIAKDERLEKLLPAKPTP